MRWLSVITAAIGLASAGIPARAAAAVAITAPQVAAAIREVGLSVGAEQVRLLSPAVAAEASPELQAVRAELWGDTQALVQMRCRDSAQCLPFYVALKWPSATAAALALRNCNLPYGQAGVASSPRPSNSRTPGAAVVVKRGEAATLVIEGQRLRMELPVVCMQNGSLGASILVRSPDSRKTYMAVVVGAKLLKAGI